MAETAQPTAMIRQWARVASPRRAYVWLAGLCLAAIALVQLLGREPTPTHAVKCALGAQAVICLLLAWLQRDVGRVAPWRRAVQAAALLTLGLLTGVAGYFFGTGSGFAALIALLLILSGLLSGADEVRLPALNGWLAYLGVAIGQALAFTLVMVGTLPDRSLVIIVIPGHPMWHHAAAHVAIQGVFLAAFVFGRAFQRRYRKLAIEVERAVGAASRREALVVEARAEYRRALAAGRHGVFSGHKVGSYRLGKVLGRGGMGEVYEGVDVDAGTRAAVKLLRGDRLHDAEVVEGFLHETEVAQKVKSPHVAEVYEAGGIEERLPYLAMERLEGENLEQIIEGRGMLAPPELRSLVDDLARALDAIHAQGVVHFDVNPRNILHVADADGRGAWKLVDFGVAQLEAARSPDAMLAGSLRYLAPERLGGAFADAHADIYGMSASLYAAVTGHEPFDDVDPAGLHGAVTAQMPGSPGGRDDLPADVELALQIGLAKKPEDRFASATELREAFASALGGELDERWRARARDLAARTPWSDEQPASAGVTEAAPDPVDEADPEPAAGSVPEPRAVEPARPRHELVPEPGTSTRSGPSRLWQAAYLGKMRGFYASVIGVCLGGALLLGAIIRNRVALEFAWVCMAGIALAVLLHRYLVQRRRDDTVYWPWMLVGLLSVGPAYAIGLNSAFSSVVAVALFAGGLFRAAQRASWIDRRGLVLAAVCLSHGSAMVLILSGVVPDLGNVRLLQQGAPRWEPAVQHGLLLCIYAASFYAGRWVDGKHEALTARAQRAAQNAARQEALLATARAELDRALAREPGGIFSRLRIGDYEVGRLLGRGGMGEVYEATHAESGQRCALKLIRGDRVGDPLHLRRFVNEASALGRVHSRHVARVLDVGRVEDGLPYIAMEYIDGRSLDVILRDEDRLGLDDLRNLVRDVTAGLSDVHGAGIVHRDLKPHNVILTESETGAIWKLVDFGVAKLADAGATTQRIIVGTPRYMAPEQALGKRVDARSDLYSFCLVVYRALTGRPAFTSDDPTHVAHLARSTGPPDPGAYVELSEELELVLRIGLAADPGDRFATAAELSRAFADAFDDALDPKVARRGQALMRREPWS